MSRYRDMDREVREREAATAEAGLDLSGLTREELGRLYEEGKVTGPTYTHLMRKAQSGEAAVKWNPDATNPLADFTPIRELVEDVGVKPSESP